MSSSVHWRGYHLTRRAFRCFDLCVRRARSQKRSRLTFLMPAAEDEDSPGAYDETLDPVFKYAAVVAPMFWRWP